MPMLQMQVANHLLQGQSIHMPLDEVLVAVNAGTGMQGTPCGISKGEKTKRTTQSYVILKVAGVRWKVTAGA